MHIGNRLLSTYLIEAVEVLPADKR